MGFTRLQSDPQLYTRRIHDDDFVIISTHVDDLFIISRDNKYIQETLESLSQSYQIIMTVDPTAFILLMIENVDL